MVNTVTNSGKQARVDIPSDNFYTPGWLVDQINYFFDGRIVLDPCADPLKRIPASNHYCFPDNGLKQKWKGNIFCNPPYSKTSYSDIGMWVAKAMEAFDGGNEVLLLLPANMDTKWAHKILQVNQSEQHCRLLFFRGRIKFLNSSYFETKGSGRFSSMLVYLGKDRSLRFNNIFGDFGEVL